MEKKLPLSFIGASLRRLRTIRECTLQEVAEQTGLSKSFLSMVENGARSIRCMDLHRVLVCYGLSVGWFYSQLTRQWLKEQNPQALEQTLEIVQSSEHTIIVEGSDNTNSIRIELLRPMKSPDDIELVQLYLPARTQLTEKYSCLPTTIKGVVLSGTLLIVLNKDEHLVRCNENFDFDGVTPHIFRNYTSEPTTILLILSPGVL